jgi:hypothetical protein
MSCKYGGGGRKVERCIKLMVGARAISLGV